MILKSERDSNPLKNLTSEEIADLGKTIDALDKEEARIKKEDLEEKKREEFARKPFKKARRSPPLEIINRSLFFVFLGSFVFSFFSIFAISQWWFLLYLISAFSCILYTPNRKAIKELLDAWPNLENLLTSKRN